jgi:hypothetical protein
LLAPEVHFLLPTTDAGARTQVIVAALVFGATIIAFRRRPELRTFVIGLATLTAAWFALRAVH